MNQAEKVNLLGLDRAAMEAYFAARGERAYRAVQLLKWIHQQGAEGFEVMTNLGKGLRRDLAETAEIRVPECVATQRSQDGTVKWLLRLADGNCIETVFIPEEGRGTLCVSSQVGCALNCSFCATARQGFNRNLTAAEIIGQLWLAGKALGGAPEPRAVTNVVMMGMGEPLLNFDNLVQAMRLMLDDNAYGLSKRRVTVSTAGIVPAIDRLGAECDVSLAVSLHAPDDALRERLVPLNRKYPLAALLAACRRYVAHQPRRRITFEYVMIAGVNDSLAQARRLIEVLADIPAKINLIPVNPFPGAAYAASAPEVVDRFRDALLGAGIMTVTRRTRGGDIAAACGQLAGRVLERTRRNRGDAVAPAGAA